MISDAKGKMNTRLIKNIKNNLLVWWWLNFFLTTYNQRLGYLASD